MNHELLYPVIETQMWFGGVITAPLENDSINPIAPSGHLILEEAAKYIVPSLTLKPHQRIQIYNQQYWWRLFNALQTNFPLVTRLFGYYAFNQDIAVPYLLKYPPSHWSLSLLGDKLFQWADENYRQCDRLLVLDAIRIDWAFSESFSAQKHPLLNWNELIQNDPNDLLEYTFFLQPHVQIFQWDYHLLQFREELLKQDIDYWNNHPFPSLSKDHPYYFVLHRNHRNLIAWKEITEGEYYVLNLFKEGSSIQEACDKIEELNDVLYQEIETNLQKWIQTWTGLGWLTTIKKDLSAASC